MPLSLRLVSRCKGTWDKLDLVTVTVARDRLYAVECMHTYSNNIHQLKSGQTSMVSCWDPPLSTTFHSEANDLESERAWLVWIWYCLNLAIVLCFLRHMRSNMIQLHKFGTLHVQGAHSRGNRSHILFWVMTDVENLDWGQCRWRLWKKLYNWDTNL